MAELGLFSVGVPPVLGGGTSLMRCLVAEEIARGRRARATPRDEVVRKSEVASARHLVCGHELEVA